MKTLAMMALLATIGLPTAVQAQTIPVDNSFNRFEGTWRGAPGTMTLLWRPVMDQAGNIAVCGVWTLSNSLLARGAQQMVRNAVVTLDGQVIARNVSGFARARNANRLAATPAKCIATEGRGALDRVGLLMGDGSFRD